jgi:hypothetical protein
MTAIPHADRVEVLEHARIVWEGEPARFAADVGRLSVGRRRLATFGCGRFWQLALMFGEIPVAPVIATDLAIAVVVSGPRLSFCAVAYAISPAVDLRECGKRSKCKTENDAYQD